MPESPVHEDSQALAPPNEVGTSRHVAGVQTPAPKPGSPKRLPECDLRRGVARLDSRHEVASRFSGQRIGHIAHDDRGARNQRAGEQGGEVNPPKGAIVLLLTAKFLEMRELPASDPYPPSALVTVLAGTETLHLIGRRELLNQLEAVESFETVAFELRYRRIDLASISNGATKGKAYRLSIVRALEPEDAA